MRLLLAAAVALLLAAPFARADENLFGYVKGAETLPEGSWELYQFVTRRSGKGAGHYRAHNLKTEFEYGVTDSFSASAALKAQSIDASGLVIDGYLPEDEDYGLRLSGLEVAGKYNFLSPALHPVGLSGYVAFNYDWLDPHSGQDKDKLSLETKLLAQKYFLEGQLIWVGNLALESTYADRGKIANLPAGFDWPTDPEMELELVLGTGMTYRFTNNWYFGVETAYESEFETEVGQERWSVFAGPSLHYGSRRWWGTFTWFTQIEGGGEQFPEQGDTGLHLIEKTEDEWRLKVGFNF